MSLNPLQVATLRWYDANQAGITRTLASAPIAMLFDGTNLVVAESNGMLVSMRASDGAEVFSLDVKGYVNNTIVPVLFPFVVQSIQQTALAFDGENIRVSIDLNTFTFVILKVRASDGSVQSYINTLTVAPHAGDIIEGVAFDGKSLWLAVGGAEHILAPYQASSGVIQSAILPTGTPVALATDGTNLWAACNDTGEVIRTQTNPASAVTFNVGSGNQSAPSGLAFDGTNMWIAAAGDNTVIKMGLNGSVLGTYSVGSAPKSLVFDGTNIWVGNTESNTVTKLRASDGSSLGTYNVGASPVSLVFDGTSIWVATSASTLIKL